MNLASVGQHGIFLSLFLVLYLFSYSLFDPFSGTGSYYVVLAGLELMLEIRMALNLELPISSSSLPPFPS